MKLKIGLDIDGTIADWEGAYIKRFKKWPKFDWAITRNVEHILINERDFWLNLPVLRLPNFEPRLFCSARVNNKRWTKQYLINLGFNVPLYQIPGYHLSKAKAIGHKCDVFIEDSIKNFIDLNTKGIPCLLIDSPTNQSWGPIGRIFSLEYNEIKEAYYLLKETVFDNFKELYINK